MAANGPDPGLTYREQGIRHILHLLEACQAQGLQPNHLQIHLILELLISQCPHLHHLLTFSILIIIQLFYTCPHLLCPPSHLLIYCVSLQLAPCSHRLTSCAPHSHLLNCFCPSFPPFVLISSTPVPLVFTGLPPVPLVFTGSPPVPLFPQRLTSCAPGSHLLPSLTELRQETFLIPLVLVRHPRSQDTSKLTYHSQTIGLSFCSTYIFQHPLYGGDESVCQWEFPRAHNKNVRVTRGQGVCAFCS